MIDTDHMHRLARRAIDAAMAAGASYADVRIADRRQLDTISFSRDIAGTLGFEFVFGLRVLYDGVWAFAFGADPSAEGVVDAAQRTVHTAAAIAKDSRAATDLLPIPIVTGEWTTPAEIDPFAVSPDAHCDMLEALGMAAERVKPNGGLVMNVQWTKETRVFASSEGSLVTQQLTNVRTGGQLDIGTSYQEGVIFASSTLRPRSGGFEILVGPRVQESIKQELETSRRYLGLPETTIDVGRHEVVVDGTTVGAMIGSTILPGLELGRVFGQEIDTVGSSPLGPPREVLGTQKLGTLLTVTADRSVPHYGATRWDDEGVVTSSFPVIQQGRIVNYFATRSQAAQLQQETRTPVKIHGTAVSWGAANMPVGTGVALTVAPGVDETATLDTLIGQVQHGYLIHGGQMGDSDSHLATAVMNPWMVFEINRGRVTRRVIGRPTIQFSVLGVWKSLQALGGAASSDTFVHFGMHGQPWGVTAQVIDAPPARFAQMDLFDWRSAE